MRKLSKDPATKQAYDKIIEQQLEEGIIELAPPNPDGSRVFYMPHKPVVRKHATAIRVIMVHDASAKPSSEDVSLNECLYIGPTLQPLSYDTLLRMRINPIWVTGDVKQAFLQVSVSTQDRDAFRFLYVFPSAPSEIYTPYL